MKQRKSSLTCLTFAWLVVFPFVATTMSVDIVRAADDFPSPLAQLSSEESRIAYCYYAFSIDVQLTAQGPDRMKVLSLIQPLKDWDNGIKRRFPDKSARSIELSKAMQHFNTHVAKFSKDNNADQQKAQRAVINRVSRECNAELDKLKDYVPPQQITQSKPPVSKRKQVLTSPKKSVEPSKAPKTPKLVSASGPNQDSPFHKGVFNPGWKGDLTWSDSDKKERLVLHSFDEIPPYSQALQIHANARIYGGNARKHCIGHLVEFDRSPDGLTLYMKPAEDGGCVGQNRVVSVNAVAVDNIRFEVRQKDIVIAAGNLRPHGGNFLTLKTDRESTAQVVAAEERPKVAVVEPIKSTARTAEVSQIAVARSEPTETTPCAMCLPVDESAAVGADSPFYPGIFDQPWKGRFGWDWHDTDLSNIQSQAKLDRKIGSNVDDHLLTLQLKYDTKYKNVCVGELREIGRSKSGYIIHFRVAPELNKPCKPRVTHAYILPFGMGDESTAELLWVLLYGDNKLISSGMIHSKDAKKLQIDPDHGKLARSTIKDLKHQVKIDARKKKEAMFKASAEYPKIAPLYEACMSHEKHSHGVMERKPYCQCVSEKVGIGGRIPDATLAGYVKNFSSLVTKLHREETTENKIFLFYRTGKTCMSCSRGNDLEPWCSGPDDLLYVATDYTKMVWLLETSAPKIEAMDFYKKVFYRTYLQGYSIFCEDKIRDPVPFIHSVTETKIGGMFSGETREIQRDETLVERRYAAKYKRFYDDITSPGKTVTSKEINRELSKAAQNARSEGALRRSFRDAKEMIAIERENRAAIRTHLKDRCDSKEVRTAYKKLLNLVN